MPKKKGKKKARSGSRPQPAKLPPAAKATKATTATKATKAAGRSGQGERGN